MQVKTCPITVKTAGPHEGAEEGIVEAIVAAYNVDSCGDQIIPGAFKKSLERHKAAGNRIPFVWSHKSDDLDSYIGEVVEAEERPEGLWMRAKLDIDEPKAAKAYRLLKGRRVSQFSFAYTEIDARPGTKDGAQKELHELEIHEAGPTMVGMNQNTQLLGVKSGEGDPVEDVEDVKSDDSVDESKAAPAPPQAPPKPPTDDENKPADPATLAAQLVKISRALLSALEGDSGPGDKPTPPTPPKPSDNGKAMPDVEPAIDSPTEAKSDESARQGTADLRLRAELDLLEAELETY